MEIDPMPALKRQVANAIKAQLARHYDPAAALLMRADRARVSDIRRGRLNHLSLERLIRYAARLRVKSELRLEHRRRTDSGESNRPTTAA
jgi:regulator of PEP synthase PpsR (kinase-PPPase family)